MKDIGIIRELALKYFEGKILPQEEIILFQFLDKERDAKLLFREWEKEWMESGMPVSESEMDASWEKMRRKICVSDSVSKLEPKSLSRSLWMKMIPIAAAVIIAVLVTCRIVDYKIDSVSRPYYVCSVAYGEKSKVTLTDGTVVCLNAGSSLKYSDSFGKNHREVTLDGEGYFEVKKQDQQEFVVHTDIYDVIVKGTKFNISAYADDPYVATTLLEGSVDVSYEGEVMQLQPGEKLNFVRESKTFVKTQVDAVQAKAWAENRIEYADITLRELAVKLSRQYNVTIQLDSLSEELLEKSFRISLRNGETIDEVLSALKQILPISVERGKDKILIK